MEQHDRTESRLFAALARVVIRFRWLVLLGSGLLCGAFVWFAAGRLELDQSLDAYIDSTSEVSFANDALRDTFGNDMVFKVLVKGDVFSPAYVERLRRLQTAIEELQLDLPSLGKRPPRHSAAAEQDTPDEAPPIGDTFGDDDGWGEEVGGSIFAEITSLLNARRTRMDDGTLRVDGWLEDVHNAEELRALRGLMLKDATLRGRLLDAGGHYSVIALRSDFLDGNDSIALHAGLEALLARHTAPGFEPTLGGYQAIMAALLSVTERDMTLLFALSLLVILVTMGAVFRHPLGVLGPVLAVVEAVAAVMWLFAFTDTSLTGLATIVPVFVMVVGVGDAVHLQSIYRELRGAGVDNSQAIERALAASGVPLLFTSLTTGAGLLSFNWANSPAVRDLGLFSGFGVFAAMFGCMTIVPALLTFNRKSTFGVAAAGRGTGAVDGLLRACSGISAGGRHRAVLAATALLALGSVWCVVQLRASNDPLKDVPVGTQARTATEELDASVGGAANFVLLLRPKEGESLVSRKSMLALERLEEKLLAYQHRLPPLEGERIVESVSSPLHVVRESWQALNDLGPEHAVVPPTDRAVADMLTLFGNASPERLKQILTVDRSAAIVIARTRWLEATAYTPLAAHVKQSVEETMAEVADVQLAGSVFSLQASGLLIVADMIRSFAIAFVVIAMFMLILLRDLRLGALAMVPNVLPIALTLAGLQMLGQQLDFSNVMIASIAIGIAVDDTIHLLHHYATHWRAHGDREAAIEHAFQHSGRAMLLTSGILVLGFCVYLAAESSSVVRFGAILGSAVLLALAVDLVCAPALLRAAYPAHAKRAQTPG